MAKAPSLAPVRPARRVQSTLTALRPNLPFTSLHFASTPSNFAARMSALNQASPSTWARYARASWKPEAVRPRRQRRCLRTTAVQPATAVTKVVGIGPSPAPPAPASSQYDDRFSRKRKQLELLQRGQSLKPNPARPASALQKRFWNAVSVKETEGTLCSAASAVRVLSHVQRDCRSCSTADPFVLRPRIFC